MSPSLVRMTVGVTVLFALTDAIAAEGGRSIYLMGSRGGAGAGNMAPVGVYFSNQIFVYQGEVSSKLPFNDGTVAGGVKSEALVDLPTLLWVTPLEIFSGNFATSLTVPMGRIEIDATVASRKASDIVFSYGDPALTSSLGWHEGKVHWQAGATINIPVGDYYSGPGDLANIARHYWAVDTFGALTWLDAETGIDISNLIGLVVNAKNSTTNYRTGTEVHWEGALTKTIVSGVSISALGYHYRQISGDSGEGATLGDFKAQVSALGLGLGYGFRVHKTPISTSIKYYHEFAAQKRLEGDSLFLQVSFPLIVDM